MFRGVKKVLSIVGLITIFVLLAMAVIGFFYRSEFILLINYASNFAINQVTEDKTKVTQYLQTENSYQQYQAIQGFVEKRLADVSDQRNYYQKNTKTEQRRSELSDLLGMVKDCPVISPEIIKKELKYVTPEFKLYEVVIDACVGHQYGLLAVPLEVSNEPPVVIVLHGTASGPEVLFRGKSDVDEASKYSVPDYHNHMGDTLANHGLVVFAPQLVTQTSSTPVEGFNKLRNQLHHRVLTFGHTLHGIELSNISASITALIASNINLDPERIGVYGVSLGGATAFYLAAIDTRHSAAVVSQWMENRDQKLAGNISAANWRYSSSSFVFQQGFSSRFDDFSMVRLILPRALFIEAGKGDGQRAQSALEEFLMWKKSFPEAYGNRLLCMELGDGDHEALLNNSLDWLLWQLGINQVFKEECLKVYRK
jgi:predicted peptidase